MEQITDTRTLLNQARQNAPPLENFQNPERTWARISQVAINHRTAARHGIVTDSQDPDAVPYERMRARLLAHLERSGARRIGITATGPECGHTALAANLALACGNLPDVKTILFDFDLRAPKLINMLGLDRIGPRYSALTGTRRSFDSTALRVSDGLTFSLNATPEEDPSRLLAAQNTNNVLRQIEEDLEPDLTLFLLPPLFPHPEALAALPLLDGTFIVAAADKTTLPEVDKAERTVAEHGSCLGILLNRCRFAGDTTV